MALLARLSMVLFVLGLSAAPFAATAQDSEASVTLTAYVCPPGMTADTLDPAACVATSEGFDVAVVPLTEAGSIADEPALTLADASKDGNSYTLSLGETPPADAQISPYGNWSIRVTAQPTGTDGYVISGDAVRSTDGSLYGFEISANAPNAVLAIYALTPEASTPPEPSEPEPTAPSAPVEPTIAATDSPVSHAARLYDGDCDNLGNAVVDLTPVVAPTGDPFGQASAIQVEESLS